MNLPVFWWQRCCRMTFGHTGRSCQYAGTVHGRQSQSTWWDLVLNDPIPKFSCVSERKWSYKQKVNYLFWANMVIILMKKASATQLGGTGKWHHTVLWRPGLIWKHLSWWSTSSGQINCGEMCDITSHHETQTSAKESERTSHLGWKYFGF